jgi:hypothetical protein
LARIARRVGSERAEKVRLKRSGIISHFTLPLIN